MTIFRPVDMRSAAFGLAIEALPGETEEVFQEILKYRKRIGFPTTYSGTRAIDQTVAALKVNGKTFFGQSGWISATGEKLKDVKNFLKGRGVHSNSQTPTHAEGHVFYQALKNGIKNARSAELFVDATFCQACGQLKGLRTFAEGLGVDELIVNVRLANGHVVQGLYDLTKPGT